MSDDVSDLFPSYIKPSPNRIVVDFARARADKLLRDKLFVFGCGHTGNLADAAGEALCLTCEIFAVKQLDPPHD